MRRVRATIVHISDLHFGRRIIRTQINRELLEPLRRLIKSEEISPNYLVISGDLADNPFPWAMKKAYDYVCEVAEQANIPPEHVLVVPGNHDYKLMGNIGLRRLTRIPFEIYFRRGWSDRGGWQERRDWIKKRRADRWRNYLSLIRNALWPWGKELRERLERIIDEERRVAIFGINSTPLFQWFGFATGRVSSDQVFAITDELRSNRERWEGMFRIAVVHHHPLPISYDRVGTTKRIEESLMVFYNAGGFLRELARQGVDLILHGHKHLSSFTRAVYDFEDRTRRSIGVLAAGSATHRRPDDPLGNEFNVIRIFDDDTVTLDRWYYAPDVMRKDQSSSIFLYDLYDLKEHRRRRDERAIGMRIGQVSKTARLTHDGYTRIEVRVQNCLVNKPDGVEAYRFGDLEVERPAYIRGLEIIREQTTVPFQRINLLDGSHLRCVKGVLSFGKTWMPTDPAFDLAYHYRLMNGHALGQLEFARKYAGQKFQSEELRWEYSSIYCERATDLIKLTVTFPEDYNMDTINDYDAVAVYHPDAESEEQHEYETSRIKGKLRKRRRRLTLDVVSPVPGFTYRIRWNYKPGLVSGQPTLFQERSVQNIQQRLIEVARNADQEPRSSIYQRIIELLNKFASGIKARYPETEHEEELDISLAVFDKGASTLRFVACSFTAIGRLIDETFMPGEGCEGFSFEKSAVVFYDRGRDSLEFYIMPSELEIEAGQPSALEEYEALVSIPWIHESGLVVGVLNVSSKSKYSRLLHLFDMQPEQQEEEKNVLRDLTRTLGEAIIGKFDQRSGE